MPPSRRRDRRSTRRRSALGRTAIAAFLAIAGLLLAACSSSGSSGDADSGSASTDSSSASSLTGVHLKVGVWSPNGTDVLLKAAGLSDFPYKVDYVNFTSTQLTMQSLAQGTLDVGMGGSIAPIFAQTTANGGGFTAVANSRSNVLYQVTLVPKNSKITTVADLKGKKVAYVANTTSHYFLLAQLRDAGLTFKDITPVPLDPATALSALLGGKVDAYAGFSNTAIVAQQQGARVLADGGKYLAAGTGANVGAVWVPTSLLKDTAKSEAVADLIARINTAEAWARTHATQWAKIQAANSGQSEAFVLALFEQGEQQVQATYGPIDQKAIKSQQDIAQTFHDAGVLDTVPDIAASYSDQLTPSITDDEAKYKSSHPDWFTSPDFLDEKITLPEQPAPSK